MAVSRRSSFLNRIFRKEAEATTERPGFLLSVLNAGGKTMAGVSISPDTAMAISAVYACCRVLAEDVAKLPIGVYEQTSDGGKVLRPNHWLHKLLQNPNPWMTRFDLFSYWMYSLNLRGNAYIVCKRNEQGIGTALVPVNPKNVQIMMDYSSGDFIYNIHAQGTKVGAFLGPEYSGGISEQVMLHHRGQHAEDGIGKSPITANRETLGLTVALERHGSQLFANGTFGSGVLTHPGKVDDPVKEKMLQQWQQRFAGQSGKLVFLDAGVQYQKLTMTSVDAEWLGAMKYQKENVCGIYRVPPHMIQSLDRSTFNNIEHQNREYYDQTLMPFLESIEAMVNKFFGMENKKLFVEFDVSRLLRADVERRYNIYAKARQWGLSSANECRMKEGDPGIGPQGDVYMAPKNMMNAKAMIQEDGNGSAG